MDFVIKKVGNWSFHVVGFQSRTAKKCTKIYNARAQLLFCSLNLSFHGVLVAVLVSPYLRTFARNFSNIDFFLNILPLRDHEFAMSEM